MSGKSLPAAQLPTLWCFPPISNPHARVLILGSMPGKESLRAHQYYAHPRNAFWPIMGALYGAKPELDYKTRIEVLLNAGIAVWDVLETCTRATSLDADIDTATMVVNDFATFYRTHPRIQHVYFNGALAEKFYGKLVTFDAHPHLHFHRLPSTSPAHAGMPYEKKLQAWRIMLAAN